MRVLLYLLKTTAANRSYGSGSIPAVVTLQCLLQ
jgi:hypothetical protein